MPRDRREAGPGTGTVPWTMVDPSKMAAGDHWSRKCRHCPAVTQGGMPGHQAHMLVCHPEQVPPAPARPI